MKEKKQFFYTLFIVVFILFLWIGFFIIPRLVEFQSLNAETENYQVKIASTIKEVRNSKKLINNIKELNMEVNNMRNKLINYSSLNDIATIIRSEFNKYNVRINYISPVLDSYLTAEKNTANQFYSRLPVEMKLEAKFMDFTHLLEQSDKLNFFLKPDQIFISKNMGNTLMIDFKASVYIKTGKSL